MPIGLEPGDTFEVEVGTKRIVFRHLSVRESRKYAAALESFLATPFANDDDAADAAIALVQPYTTAQIPDLLGTAEAVVLPLAFHRQRQITESELGKSLWRLTLGEVKSATDVVADASIALPPTNP
jgi:hypothetical protein